MTERTPQQAKKELAERRANEGRTQRGKRNHEQKQVKGNREFAKKGGDR